MFIKKVVTFVLVFVFMAIADTPVFAAEEPEGAKGTIGFNYARAVDDSNWGVHGDYETALKPFLGFDADGVLQSGDVYRGNFSLALTFDLGRIDVRLKSFNDLKGYTLSTIGRVNNLSASLVYPIGDTEVAVGIFGRNGNSFAAPSAVDVLVPQGFVESQLLELGLADVFPKDRGLTLPDGSAVGVSVETAFDFDRFEVELDGLFEAAGDGPKAHKGVATFTTGGTLIHGFGWNITAILATQLYDGNVEYENATVASVTYEF